MVGAQPGEFTFWRKQAKTRPAHWHVQTGALASGGPPPEWAAKRQKYSKGPCHRGRRAAGGGYVLAQAGEPRGSYSRQ